MLQHTNIKDAAPGCEITFSNLHNMLQRNGSWSICRANGHEKAPAKRLDYCKRFLPTQQDLIVRQVLEGGARMAHPQARKGGSFLLCQNFLKGRQQSPSPEESHINLVDGRADGVGQRL